MRRIIYIANRLAEPVQVAGTLAAMQQSPEQSRLRSMLPCPPPLPAGSDSDVSDAPTSAEGHSQRALKASKRSITKTRARVSAALFV